MLLLWASASPGPAEAEEPAAAGEQARQAAAAKVNAQFGSRVAEVRATRANIDDVQLGQELAQAAAEVADDPHFRAALTLLACELLFTHSDGFAAIGEALPLLSGAYSDDRQQVEDKLIQAYDMHYRRVSTLERQQVGPAYLAAILRAADYRAQVGRSADAMALYRKAQSVARIVAPEQGEQINNRIKDLREQELLVEKRAELEQQLEQTPSDDAARLALAGLVATEFDDLAAAQTLAKAIGDPATRARMIDALTLDQPAADVETALASAEWWSNQYDGSSTAAKPRVLPGLRRAYERVLDADAGQGSAAATRATLSLQIVRDRMREMGLHYVPRFKHTRNLAHREGLIRSMDLGQPLGRVALQPQGAWGVASGRRSLIFFDIDEGLPVRVQRMPANITRLAISPDGQRVTAGGDADDREAVFGEWSIETGNALTRIASLPGKIANAEYVKGRPVVGVTGPQTTLWLLDADRALAAVESPGAYHLAWPARLRSVTLVALIEGVNHIQVADPVIAQAHTVFMEPNPVVGIRLSANGERMLLLNPNSARIYDTTQDQTLTHLRVPAPEGDSPDLQFTAAALSSDGRRAAVAYQPGSDILVFNTADGLVLQTLKGHTSPVRGLVFSDDGSLLLSTAGSSVNIWGIARQQP